MLRLVLLTFTYIQQLLMVSKREGGGGVGGGGVGIFDWRCLKMNLTIFQSEKPKLYGVLAF